MIIIPELIVILIMEDKPNKVSIEVPKEDLLQFLEETDLTDYGFQENEDIYLQIEEDTKTIHIRRLIQFVLDVLNKVDDAIFNAEKDHLHVLSLESLDFNNSKTAQTILRLYSSINILKLGMFDICKTLNLYSASILYRSFLEHFLKTIYVIFRFAEEKDDSVGEDYLIYADAENVIKNVIPASQINNLINKNKSKVKLNYYELLCEMYPKYNFYSEEKIRQTVNKFRDNTKIYKYLFHEVDASDSNPLYSMLGIIADYSDYSSFVHGAPNALFDISLLWDDETKVQKECAKLARSVFYWTVYIKIMSLIILGQDEKSAFQLYYKILNILKKYDEDLSQIDKYLANNAED